MFTEEFIEKEHEEHQLLLHAPDAIIVINEHSRIIFWNLKAEAIFGWTTDEALGQSLSEMIIPPVYREAHAKGMKLFLATGQANVLNKTIEITALNKKGEEFYISLTISTAFQNEKISFIAFIRDITQQKMNDLELERKRTELEKTNKELEQFAYAASHDMQEPLRKIRTFASFLIESAADKLNAIEKTYLLKISIASERMKTLIDDLLNYSHQTVGQTFIDVDLNIVVQNVLHDLELLIQQKKGIITVDSLPAIKAIPVQMDQLFYNLLHNSLKFSKQNIPPFIHIGCLADKDNKEPGEGKAVDIYIKDNGLGFDPEYAEKIFVLFQRLNTRHVYEGSGIGLTLCKKIVENHRGKIWVESEPGIGTRFFIRLPVN